MDGSGHADPIDDIDRKVHLRGNRTSQVGDSALMSRRVGIPRFNGHGNGMDGRCQSFSYPFDRLFAVRDILIYAFIIEDLSLFITNRAHGH